MEENIKNRMSNRNRIFKNYKHFLVFATIIFLIIECSVLSVFYFSNKIESDNIGQRSIFEAEQVVNPIFRENESLIYLLSYYINDMVSEGVSLKEIEIYLSKMAKEYRETKDSNFFGVYGVIDGVYINSEPFTAGPDYIPEERPWYIAAMEDQENIGITNPYKDLQTGETVLSFAKVLPNGRGVVAIDVWLRDVINITKKLSTEGIEAVYITDNEGNIIFHSMDEFLGLNFHKNAKNEEESALASAILDNPNSSFEMTLRGNRCKVFNAVLYDSWNAVVIIDLFKEFQADGWYIFLYSTLILVGFIAILYATYHYDLRRQSSENLTGQLLAAATIYRSMSILDIENDTLQELNSDDDVGKILGGVIKGIKVGLEVAIRHFAMDESCDKMLEFVDLDTIDERMEGKNTIEIEFLENVVGWCRARLITVEYNDVGKLKKVLLAIEVIDEEKRRENQLRYLSEMDGLTGINNRASGEQSIRSLMASNNAGMFCLMDVDKFKSINDTFGHGIGDEVLVAISNSLKESFRDMDVVMRLGGDEFAVYAVNATEIGVAEHIIERFFESVDRISIPKMGDTKVKVSLGATFFNGESDLEFEELYTKADEGLYISKKTVGNIKTIVY